MTLSTNRRSTTQDITWFLDLHSTDQLDLNPPYQRRSVWSPRDRRFFLDTVFRGFPSPAIFLYKTISKQGKTTYSVVDGKQRLQTILSFSQNAIAMDKNYGDVRLNGKKWNDIKKDEVLARQFWDYVLPVEFIDVTEGTVINDVFDRLNRNSRKLVEQELRHAKFDGWFIKFVESESENDIWKNVGLVTTARVRRMKDVQFLSELLIVVLVNDVMGFDHDVIDKYYADYEVPSETLNLEFDEDLIKSRFFRARDYLLELEQVHKLVTTLARDLVHFYSLWSVIALGYDRLPKASDFSAKYIEFIQEVNNFKDEKYLQSVIDGKVKPKFPVSLKYFQNSIGASTEFRQRAERWLALDETILGRAKT